ncbi:MAG: AI-2E family transporter [Paracoccaceae bacterium]|nr:AI-2E family transporter [Paracoccaceae bacterium]
MALPVRDQFRYWGIAAAIFFVVLWYLGDVILPFILGGAVAYFLDPVADWLERHRFSRVMATTTITFFAAIIMVLAALLVIPTLVKQLIGLVETAPALVAGLRAFLTERFPDLADQDSQLYHSLVSVGETLQSKGGVVLQSVLSSVGSIVNVLIIAVLVPVVTFYLLMDWDRMVREVDRLLPRDHAPAIRKLAADIDKTLSAFIRGQGSVVLIMGAYYGILLMLVGLQFGLIVGFTAGLISFIPYVGAIVGGALAFGLAIFQFWGEWIWLGAVVAVFFGGQFIEGNILTPNLVGSSVGLHPVWLIFALSVFGSLFGFVGMLVAVPLAAAMGVLVRFALNRYQDSRLYKGLAGTDDQ